MTFSVVVIEAITAEQLEFSEFYTRCSIDNISFKIIAKYNVLVMSHNSMQSKLDS